MDAPILLRALIFPRMQHCPHRLTQLHLRIGGDNDLKAPRKLRLIKLTQRLQVLLGQLFVGPNASSLFVFT